MANLINILQSNMGYFQVRYDSRVVNYDHRLATGVVVIGGHSCSKGRGFESRHHILDGHNIFHIYLL